jgi:DNA-binding transcriptional MerR regulator
MQIGELARRAGVTPDCLRAWERRYGLLRPRRTRGNRRLYSPADVARVDLMKRHVAAGKPAAQAAELAGAARLTIDVGAAARVPAREALAARAELREALDRFQESPAQRVLERLFSAHSRLAVLRDVILPYLRDLGERWASQRLSVAQEHFASGFLEARLLAMARGWDRGPGPGALLACPAGERHTFGLVAFGIALNAHGWRVTYLGADTPSATVAVAAEQVAPELVVLAATAADRFIAERDRLAAVAGGWPCAVAGAGATPAVADVVGARYLESDPVTAAGRLRDGLWTSEFGAAR